MSDQPRDQFSRPLRDLRISVTDRCNFRCPYCMPKEVFGPDHAFLRDPQLVSLEELGRIVRAFRVLGVEKVRLTGGEPLLRADLPEIVRVLKQEVGVPDVALTTNGWLLAKHAAALHAAGLNRVNVSVDSLDEAVAARMKEIALPAEAVAKAIAYALDQPPEVEIGSIVIRPTVQD